MATAYQIKKIHTLKSRLCLDDDLYRDMLMSFGVCSSKNLTYTEALVFTNILEEKAVASNVWVKQPKQYENLNRDDEMATPAQLRMIKGIWREIVYFEDAKFAKKSIRKFLKNKFRVDDIMFLTKTKATKVIQGLKAMKKRLQERVAAR